MAVLAVSRIHGRLSISLTLSRGVCFRYIVGKSRHRAHTHTQNHSGRKAASRNVCLSHFDKGSHRCVSWTPSKGATSQTPRPLLPAAFFVRGTAGPPSDEAPSARTDTPAWDSSPSARAMLPATSPTRCVPGRPWPHMPHSHLVAAPLPTAATQRDPSRLICSPAPPGHGERRRLHHLHLQQDHRLQPHRQRRR